VLEVLKQTEPVIHEKDMFDAAGLDRTTDELRSIYDMVRKVAECGAQLLGVSRFGIWGAADGGDTLLPQFVYGLGGEQDKGNDTTELQPLDLVIIRRVFEGKSIIKADWVRPDHTLGIGPLIPGSKTSIMGAVWFKQRLVGLVHADDLSGLRKWTTNDLGNMAMLANLTSLALGQQPFGELMGEREDGMGALVTISSRVLELTGNADLLLQLITEKARQLLNSDISLISIVDKTTNEHYLKASSGPISESFKRALRIPANLGMTGWTHREKKPAVCFDYATDPRVTPELKALAEQEGIKSTLAVPLIIGDEVVGVLSMSKRSNYQFSARDIGLASAFANLVSIAIQNSEFYREQQEMLVKLEVLNDRLRRKNKAIERARDIHQQFIMIELEGGGVDNIANALARLVDNHVLVEDRYGELLAIGIHKQKIDDDSLKGAAGLSVLSLAEAYPQARQQLELLAEKKRSVYIKVAETDNERVRLVTPIIAQSEILGYVSVPIISQKMSRLDVTATTEYAALVLALDMMKQKSIFEAEQRAKGDFLSRLLSGDYGSEEELLKQASYLGYHPVWPRRIMIMRVDSPASSEAAKLSGEPMTRSILDQLLRNVNVSISAVSPGSMAIITNEDIVVFAVSEENDEELSSGGFAERLALTIKQAPRQIHPELTASVGIGCLCQKLEDYKKSYHQARKALNIANWVGKRDEIVLLEALGVYGLLFESDNRERLLSFSREMLDPLVRYDREHSTNLLKTLSTYLKCNCNLRVAAGILFVHRHTVRQRLERIEQLCKVELGDADDKLALQLAIKVWETEQYI